MHRPTGRQAPGSEFFVPRVRLPLRPQVVGEQGGRGAILNLMSVCGWVACALPLLSARPVAQGCVGSGGGIRTANSSEQDILVCSCG